MQDAPPRAPLRLPPWRVRDALPGRAPPCRSPGGAQGKKQDYTYRLMTKVSAYNGGLVSPTGYYKLNVQGGQYTTFTYWWQVRRCHAGRGARRATAPRAVLGARAPALGKALSPPPRARASSAAT